MRGKPGRKRLGERWPWNRLVRRPRNIPSTPTPAPDLDDLADRQRAREEAEDEAAERAADTLSPLEGDSPHTHEDLRTPDN